MLYEAAQNMMLHQKNGSWFKAWAMQTPGAAVHDKGYRGPWHAGSP